MMDSAQFAVVREIVADALELHPAGRPEFVSLRCKGDAVVCAAAMRLLREADRDAGALSDAAIDHQRLALEAAVAAPVTTKAPIEEEFAGYRILRQIGEGGMGVVYEAEQAQPNRRVALKVVDGLRLVGELEQRLRLESEIQGRLQHPGIAQVYEAGIATVGRKRRPYFAMELIQGRPIAAHAESAGIDARGRIELIAKTAEAIGFAHSKGIIHRDLKPDNVLVTEDGQPKVLDFGIARLTGEVTLAVTTMTREGQILGTLAYMAPEQLNTVDEGITPAADVYALGIMLFELLTRRMPFELGGLSISAAIRLVDNEPPPKLRTVDPRMARDVETIVGKCLEREPTRRYQDGWALASDLRRFVENRPITARPPTLAYRSAKVVHRNKVLVGGAAATVAVLIIGITVAAWFAIGQSRASLLALQNQRLAEIRQVQAAAFLFSSALERMQSGDLYGSAEQLEQVSDGIRGWPWRLLASGLPRWIPGDGGFGGSAWDGPGEPKTSVSGRFLVVRDGTAVLTAQGELLQVWSPNSGQIESFLEFPIRRWAASQGDSASPIVVFGEDDSARLFHPDTGQFDPMPAGSYVRTSPNQIYVPQLDVMLAIGTPKQAEGGGTALRVVERDGREHELTLPFVCAALNEVVVLSQQPRRVLLEAVAGWSGRYVMLNIDERRIEAVGPQNTGPYRSAFELERRELALPYPLTARLSNVQGVTIYDLDTLEKKRQFGATGMPIAFVLGGDALVTVGEDRVMNVVRSDNGTLIRTIGRVGRSWSDDLLPSATVPIFDGTAIAHAVGANMRLFVNDVIEPEQGLSPAFEVRPVLGSLYNLAVSPGGGLLAVRTPWNDDAVHLLDSRTGVMLAHLPLESDDNPWRNEVALLFFTPDGSELITTAQWDTERGVELVRWNLLSGDVVRESSGQSAQSAIPTIPLLRESDYRPGQSLSSRAVVSTDGETVLIGEDTLQRYRAIDIRSGDQIETPLPAAYGIAVHPAEPMILAADDVGLRQIDPETLGSEAGPSVPASENYAVSFAPDGATLALGSQSGAIKLIDVATMQFLYEFDTAIPAPDTVSRAEHSGPRYRYIYQLGWSPDGERLYSAHAHGFVRAWDARRPRERREWLAQTRESVIAFGDDIERLIDSTGSESEAIARLRDKCAEHDRGTLELAIVKRWARRSDPVYPN